MDERASFEPRAVLGRRAGSNRLAIVVPVVALIGAVWIGTSGPRSDASTADERSGQRIAQATTAADPVNPTQGLHQEAAYPGTVLGIEVRTVADLDSSTVRDHPVLAVAGWYVAWPSLGCPTRTGVDVAGFVAELGHDANIRTFCDRSGVLSSTPNPTGSTPALSVSLTPGVVVPPEIADPDATPAEVILVGRVSALSNQTDQASSGRQMVVNRVVLAEGLGRAQTTTSILPKLLDRGPLLSWRPRDRLAEAMIGPTGAILMETLVDPATLAFVDPDAAALVADTSPRSERIWYRLALGIDPARIARWIAIDDTTGAVVGTGILGMTSVFVVKGAEAS